MILAFHTSAAALAAGWAALVAALDLDGGLWIAWPKRASGVPTDLTEDAIRARALAAGLVDNKVCAIDATWSGLRLVRRLADRKRALDEGTTMTKSRPVRREAAAKPAAAKKPEGRGKPAARAPAPLRRADFGAPIDAAIARQPPHLRAIVEALRALAGQAAPAAAASLKWGMPTFSIGGKMFCSFGMHKAHVNLVLVGPAAGFADPQGLLEGASEGGRHLKLTALEQLPRKQALAWLKTAAAVARSKA